MNFLFNQITSSPANPAIEVLPTTTGWFISSTDFCIQGFCLSFTSPSEIAE